MITITMKHSGDEYYVSAKGHAEYNPGEDIVCSAVSCLFYAFAGYLKNNDNVRSNIRLESGNSEIEAHGHIMECYDMLKVGLLQIEASYPDHVKVVLT